jgi:4-amino-4-deoxy-L-arabinose transferase-like glycosyltransferase
MLAAQRVVEHGWPILPSGLFYDHGLLLSYLTAPLLALVGFKEEMARWPVLLLSVLTIAVAYGAGRRLFNSPLAGLVAAALVALDELSIIWGTRARMYSLAYLFALLSVTWLVVGTLQQPQARTRYIGLLWVLTMLFSHSITFLLLPPLAGLILLFSWLYRRAWLRRPGLWREVIAAGAVVLIVLAVVRLGQISSTTTLQERAAASPPPLGLEILAGFFDPGLSWTRFDNLIGFFESPLYAWLHWPISLALLLALYRLIRRRVTLGDVALPFLALLIGGVIFAMGALLNDTWSKSRYVFILALPAYGLLAAGSLAQLTQLVLTQAARLGRPFVQVVQVCLTLASLGAVGWQAGPTAWRLTQAQSTGDYHTAFAYVRANQQPGDRVMTVQPAAAYLYLGRCDYYANQLSALVLAAEGEENTPLDRYTGSPLIDSVEKLNPVLASGRRLWFVTDATRLYERFEPWFTQQIFAQMDLARQTGQTYVFLSRPYPVPVPAQPQSTLNANFSGVIQLQGYSLNLQAGTLSVGLFWQLIGVPAKPFKLFVQLRNHQGQTVAQADHYLLENLLTVEAWQAWQQQDEWLRDTAELPLPEPLPAAGAPYRLFIGFYNPATQVRVPLFNDSSGENAAVIEVPLPP